MGECHKYKRMNVPAFGELRLMPTWIVLNDKRRNQTNDRNETHDKNQTHDRNIANDRNDPNDGNETNQTNDANVFTCRTKR